MWGGPMPYNMNIKDMQKMMTQEMQQMMQNTGMPGIQLFYQPVPYSPENNHKAPVKHTKKVAPKHNVVNGGVQI